MEASKVIRKKLYFTSSKIEKLLSILCHYGESRIIGGAVRDSIIGLENNDIDIATTIHPKQVMELLQDHNIKAIPTGIDYGTITCLLGQEVFEITTLRKDVQCFGRKAVVKFSQNFQEDSLRRDFTINALSYDYFSEEIYDYTGGYHNLLNREVKFIGNAYDRINEDYLRILRFFRFVSKYSDAMDLQGLQASQDLIPKIQHIAKERIQKEIILLFTTKNVGDIISILQERGMLKYIFSKIDFDASLIKKASQSNLGPVDIIGLSIINLDSNLIKSELRYLKFPNKVINSIRQILNLKLLIQQESLDFAIKILKLEHLYTKNMLVIAACSINIPHDKQQDLLTFYNRLDIPELPISGGDFVAAGMKNEQIGIALKKAKSMWIKGNFNMTSEELLYKFKKEIDHNN